MTPEELFALIRQGENSGVEFKRDDLRREQLAREVVAFANFQGGRLLIGVEDDGTVTGIQREDLEHWVIDTVFGRTVHPQLLPYYETVRVDDGKQVAVVTVLPGTAKPYVVRHNQREDIYVRVGSTSQLATREQQAALFASGGLLHAELLPVSGSALADLDRARLTDYLGRVLADEVPPDEPAWLDRLCGLGFMMERTDGPPVCTIAGAVLFAHRPRRLLRQAGLRWMAFSGDDMDYQALDDRVLDAPLVGLWSVSGTGQVFRAQDGLIEIFMERALPLLSAESAELVEHLRRERRWFYPPEAVRECLLNAFAHRDWTRPAEVEVVRYGNRLTVTSPGALQNAMTIDKMLAGQRSARNPIIVEVLRDYGYVDARGMGVRRKIVPLIRQSTGSAPVFEPTEYFLRVTLPATPISKDHP
ncbi:Divergent AAA domain protein [Thiorhodovibrio winogradskyi]|uniref:Divergent AAA domain protein n=1 Tax=Thiorhodovibrio winogradskyi TaxID=77007 RepID=A0ABZ0SD92_9GAMM|nr:RNA-binding domain-containing protein [Thiorhodovibrio winogradskyi]